MKPDDGLGVGVGDGPGFRWPGGTKPAGLAVGDGCGDPAGGEAKGDGVGVGAGAKIWQGPPIGPPQLDWPKK
jgi:hypothetical protein